MNDMKSIVFNGKRKYKKLHIEVPGAIINITVDLVTVDNKPCTVVDIIADNFSGEEWHLPDIEAIDKLLPAGSRSTKKVRRYFSTRVVKEKVDEPEGQ